MQATYNGYPLYTFGSDSAPGQVNGNGSAGVRHVIMEKAPASSAAAGSWYATGSAGSGAWPGGTGAS